MWKTQVSVFVHPNVCDNSVYVVHYFGQTHAFSSIIEPRNDLTVYWNIKILIEYMNAYLLA